MVPDPVSGVMLRTRELEGVSPSYKAAQQPFSPAAVSARSQEVDAGGLGTFLSYRIPAGLVQHGREIFCWKCDSQNTVFYCLLR